MPFWFIMAKRKWLFILFLILVIGSDAVAQENRYLDVSFKIDSLIRDLAENIAENLGEDYDLSELTQRLHGYLKHPINLNNTTPEQLKEIGLLSPLQIGNLFDYITRSGELKDLLELQAIEKFDVQAYNRILPFVVIKPSSKLKALNTDHVQSDVHDLMLRYGRILQTQKGFTPLPGSRYLGTPDKLLIRYRYAYSPSLSVSLVAEKDPGEYLAKKGSVADHLAFNITLLKQGRLKKFVLGDYSLQFGQGLTLWSGFSFGKGPDVTSVASKDLGLRPYNSSNESSFFRGAAATIALSRNFDVTTFLSNRKLDASLKFPENESPTLQNINISGLHRTPTELKNQKSLKQQVYGAALQYTKDGLTIGAVAYQSLYGHNFIIGTQRYNKYAFEGRQLTNLGLHYNYTFKNLYLFGESAHSLKSGWAVIHGAMASLSPKVSAVVLHRNYDRDYHNFFSNSIGEATEINNEKGLYFGLNFLPSRKWNFSCYTDYFRFPWLKYRVDSASSGYELLGQTTYAPSKQVKILLRYKRELKQQNPDAGIIRDHLDKVCKQSFRLDWSWQLGRKFNSHQRIELMRYRKGNEKFRELQSRHEAGYLILNDIDYKPSLKWLSGNIRLAYFSTSSYDSRIYAYEDDVLYGATSGVYSGKGIRSYINIRFRLMKQMDLWTRYAISIYSDQKTIGSGLDEISGNQKSDFKVQLRYLF